MVSKSTGKLRLLSCHTNKPITHRSESMAMRFNCQIDTACVLNADTAVDCKIHIVTVIYTFTSVTCISVWFKGHK